METLEALAAKLGRKQRLLIMALTEEWGPSIDHQCAKRIWWRFNPMLIHHRHKTDNCWQLSEAGLALRAHLLTQKDHTPS